MKKLDRNSIILICLIILIIIIMLTVFIMSLTNGKKDTEVSTTTTTTTKEVIKEKISFSDELYNINLEIEKNENIDDKHKLVVEEVKDKIKIDNIVKVYDINLYDEENNLVSVKDTNIVITIPYVETIKYDSYNVLYLSDSNEILETIPATYLNGYIKFNVSHLSRYAIVGVKSEVLTTSSTTRKTTTKATTTTTTTQATTKKVEEVKTTTTTTTTTQTTTQKVEETTTKAKTYSYKWDETPDAAGQYYLFIVDENGNKVSGSLTITYAGTTYSETIQVPTSGVLLAKSIISNISNVKAK